MLLYLTAQAYSNSTHQLCRIGYPDAGPRRPPLHNVQVVLCHLGGAQGAAEAALDGQWVVAVAHVLQLQQHGVRQEEVPLVVGGHVEEGLAGVVAVVDEGGEAGEGQAVAGGKGAKLEGEGRGGRQWERRHDFFSLVIMKCVSTENKKINPRYNLNNMKIM